MFLEHKSNSGTVACYENFDTKTNIQKCATLAYSIPQTAALPEFRVREVPTFSKVGVDFAGPL